MWTEESSRDMHLSGSVVSTCIGGPDVRTVPASDRARFWLKVEKSPDPEGCWMWIGGLYRTGYGAFYFDGKMCRAHAVSYLWFNGPIPEGLHICHVCPGGGNRWCVNPRHLVADTRAANMRHAVESGRTARGMWNGMNTHPYRHWSRSGSTYRPDRAGQKNASARLTDELVIEIRRRCAAGEPQKDIAREIGVSTGTVSLIANGKTWKHLL